MFHHLDRFRKNFAAKEMYAKQKAKENTVLQRNQMLKLLEGEDLTGIDINTDEGKRPFIDANLAILTAPWVFYWSPGVRIGP